MTEKQYQRALQIGDRLKQLDSVKKHIENTKKHRLWYACDMGEFNSRWVLTHEWEMIQIGEILDKHDLMIRQEIDEEIERLKAEIETL